MKQPKFKIGDKITLAFASGVYEITSVTITKDEVMYGCGAEQFSEMHCDFYVEPKQKVKMWQYAFQMDGGRWTTSYNFYKDDADFQKIFLHVKKFKKLEWSMIEVECD